MTVYESLDDKDDAIDAIHLTESSMFIQFVNPTPGSLALLGVGGLIVARHRRK